MLSGVGKEDIRREVLITKDISSRSSFEIISFIESKKMGRHALENSQKVSAVSLFQRLKKHSFNVGDKSKYVHCHCCKKLFYPFKRKETKNAKPFKYCLYCWRRQSNKLNAV